MEFSPSMSVFSGKIAVVTGAAQGIGEATVRRLAAEGARVFCIDLSEKVHALVADIGPTARAVVADVGNTETLVAAIDDCCATWGGVDILINNAGIDGTPSILANSTETDFDHVIDVNLRSCWASMRRVLPTMIARGGGSVVNIASVAALTGFETLAIYAASKAAVVGMTRSVALEYGLHNIRVNAICPGGVLTPLALSFMKKGEAEMWAQRHALKRFAEPAEIAAAVVFLASDQASFITGTAIPVDGGFTA